MNDVQIAVELDVFSGRPNPAWQLETADAQQLDALLHNLPEEPSPVPADGLGYRGFIVTLTDGNIRQALHVYAGRVWSDTDNSRVFKDENGVEQLLMQMAKQKGYGDILKSLGVD